MRWLRLVCGLLLAIPTGFAASPLPSGEVAELHDCEVFTGNCTASGEATQGGRTALRVWKIERGSFRGRALDGALAAVIETADENLAADPAAPSRATIYLASGLDSARQETLLAWLREKALRPGVKVLAVEEAPIVFRADGEKLSVRIGSTARFQTAALPSCGMASCGEQMVYEPRSAHAGYVALLNQDSSVVEPRLNLAWQAHGMRSVFFAKFDDAGPPSPADSTPTESCHGLPPG